NVWSGASDDAAPDRYRVFLTSDRAAYRPGEQVALAGFVRRTHGQANVQPPAGLQALLTARQIGAPGPIYRETLAVSDTGAISGAFTLPADAPLGEYILAATVGSEVFHTTFVVRADSELPLHVAVSAAEPAEAG